LRPGLPTRVISWYGDDFTGSTDVLEVLAPYMPAVLFLRQPDDGFFEQFSHYAAFGLAGSSRSESPEWMDNHLAGAFEWLGSLGTSVCHYKVCSTFDSSPRVGNIGRAAEIGKRVFGSRFVPMVVGAPALRRYTVFGNLFAATDGTVYRIDRHPTMKCHPVTPMREADLRVHMKQQTDLRISLLDVLQLSAPDVCEQFRAVNRESEAVLIDIVNEQTLSTAGRLLWSVDRQQFIVGSSGVEYALTAFWSEDGLIGDSTRPSSPGAADRIVILSGSCSPVTQRQIDYAGRHGFALVGLDVHGLTAGDRSSIAAEEACRSALEALSQGRSVVLFTAASPSDRVETFRSAADQLRFRHTLSERAGQILSRVVDGSGVTRIVVAGGDTSSHGGRQLGIDALTFISHVAPGAPLCRTWSRIPNRQNLEIVFKGGQCGKEDFFETVLTARWTRGDSRRTDD
jgi:uncharacterized protein YgbK (DUF1537 family)